MPTAAAALPGDGGDWLRALARTPRLHSPKGAVSGRIWKEVREVAAVTEWAAAIGVERGLKVSHIRSHPRQDAPDCLFRLGRQDYTAEVTELIDEDLAKYMSARARFHDAPVVAPPSLRRGYWDETTFREKLSHRIARKRDVADNHNRRIDALIITTFEPLLDPRDVANWLARWPMEPTHHVRSGWLLMEEDPRFSPHQPLFQLFGDIPPPPTRRLFFF